MSYGILFAGTDIETGTPGFKITGKDVHSIPTPVLEQYVLARKDGQAFVAANYPERKIIIDGVINGNNQANAEQNLDTLKGLLNGWDQNLDIPYANSTRRWIATMSNLILPKSIGSFIPISIEFECSQAIGQDTTTTTPSLSTITTASSTQAVTIGGSWYCKPTITITLNSGTGLTGSITITNPATGLAMTITRTWTAADVLVIDCNAQTVKVNGTVVDSSGAFPLWLNGSQNFQYTDTFTTRNVTPSFVYNKAYL